jgi:hypothetical protein
VINPLQAFRTPCGAAAALAALVCVLSAGCGNKKPAEAPPSVTSAPAAGTAPVQGRVTTGADPDKAPPYPGMYGKPAGSR